MVSKARYLTRVTNGLCTACGRPKEDTSCTRCNSCRMKETTRAKVRGLARVDEGLCIRCASKILPTDKNYCETCRTAIQAKRQSRIKSLEAKSLCRYCGSVKENKNRVGCTTCCKIKSANSNKRLKEVRHGRYGTVKQAVEKLRSVVKNGLSRQGLKKPYKSSYILGASATEVIEFMGGFPLYEYHIDHICPMSQAQTLDEALKLNHYWNLQFLPKQDNLKKSNKLTQEAIELCEILLDRKPV